MWTYQEIILASNPIIVSGHDHLACHTFAYYMAILEYSGVPYRSHSPSLPSLGAWVKAVLGRDYMQWLHLKSMSSMSRDYGTIDPESSEHCAQKLRETQIITP